MKILVSNETYWIKGKESKKKYMEWCLQAFDIKKKYKKKAIKYPLNWILWNPLKHWVD